MSKLFQQLHKSLVAAAAICIVAAVSCSKDKDPEPVITTQSTNTFTVADIPAATYEGATFKVAVKSQTAIQTLSDGEAVGEPKTVTQPWSVEYSTDEGVSYSTTAPEWLKITRNESDGNATVTIQPQTATSVVKGPDWTAERGTEESPYNLSNATGAAAVENTANCYIVNGPGWYKLPLVYGNAIKAGATNAESYTSPYNTFVNHLNQPIADPYLYNNGATPAEAVIVWQDAEKEVITAPSLCDNNTFLKFRVTPETINYDNAIVAIKDGSGAILWSWHIWVTSYKLGEGDFAHTSAAYLSGDGVARTFMAFNIGYLPEATTTTTVTYPARSCKAKFTMTDSESGKSESVVKDVTQTSFSEAPVTQPLSSERHLYYQAGRKDPLRGDGPTIACPTNYGDAAQNPGAFYTTTGERWQLAVKTDTWHSGLATYTDLAKGDAKTIYDPSPVGYCVPNSYAFKGFTTANGGAFSKGYTWEGSFFAAAGYLNSSDGQLTKKELEGWYRSAALDGDFALPMVFHETNADSFTYEYVGYGCSIRAVKDGGKGNPDKGSVDIGNYGDDPDRNPDLK